jgi:hypothetical protein
LINVSQLQAKRSPSQKDNKENPIILIQVRGGNRHIIQAMQVEPVSWKACIGAFEDLFVVGHLKGM